MVDKILATPTDTLFVVGLILIILTCILAVMLVALLRSITGKYPPHSVLDDNDDEEKKST